LFDADFGQLVLYAGADRRADVQGFEAPGELVAYRASSQGVSWVISEW
jgi:hypothetical protein